MEHVVFFPAGDGSPAFRRVPSLDEAVRLVEHLRNVEGLSTVSVHALTEVPLAFRAYYRVEVPTDAVPAQQVVEHEAAPRVEPERVEVPALALVEPVAEPFVEPVVEPVAELAPEPVAELAPEPQAPAEEEPVLVSSNGHAPAGPASLGFFA